MQIRQANAQDMPAVTALWETGWHQGHAKIVPQALLAARTSQDFATRAMARMANTYVAFEGEDFAGFYMLDGDELEQFYVAAAFQGRGVAGKLMASAEAALAGRVAWLACSVGNDRAAGFYAKAGWQRVAEEVYKADTTQGPVPLSIWRYEKDLT